jgi:hypothetical protein
MAGRAYLNRKRAFRRFKSLHPELSGRELWQKWLEARKS